MTEVKQKKLQKKHRAGWQRFCRKKRSEMIWDVMAFENHDQLDSDLWDWLEYCRVTTKPAFDGGNLNFWLQIHPSKLRSYHREYTLPKLKEFLLGQDKSTPKQQGLFK